jgi:signal transduction histidine kinase
MDGVVTDDERRDEYLAQMLAETKLLQRLVGDLLDLARLQNMDFKIEKQPVALCSILQDVKRGAENVAAQKNVSVSLAIQSEDCVMLGDFDRIRQMFMVVVDNAVKFSPEGGEVFVSLLEKKKTLLVSVRDNGKGIPQNELPGIFDRFAKTEDPVNKSGTGLGLAIAKQIALRHDITIRVQSEEGRGTEFIFEIPKYDLDK